VYSRKAFLWKEFSAHVAPDAFVRGVAKYSESDTKIYISNVGDRPSVMFLGPRAIATVTAGTSASGASEDGVNGEGKT